jgi:hypothetical protein
MDKIKALIVKKSAKDLLISLVYLLLIIAVKWNIHPNLATLLFLIGGVMGIYFLDIAEIFFKLTPSPFSSIVFCAAFVVVSLFIVTSSGSALAGGLVLMLYLVLIMRQLSDFRVTGNLESWYRMVAGPISFQTQNMILAVFMIIFLVESLMFVW